MKNSLLILVVLVAILTSCNRKEQPGATSNDRDSLVTAIQQRDSAINEFLAVNSEIERNLDSIAVRQGAISLIVLKEKELETQASLKDRLNADIIAINDMMNDNRKKIEELSRKLKNSNSTIAEYDKMIKHLNERIAVKDKDFEILNSQTTSLSKQVARLQTSVNYLANQNNLQQQKIADQTAVLHTAYFVVGKSKDLVDKKVINKTGGLLGIGRTSQLDPNIDNSQFTKIDYTQVTSIEINSSKAKIITSHPSDSYSLDQGEDKKITNLRIFDPEKFWSASKYLVVVKD